MVVDPMVDQVTSFPMLSNEIPKWESSQWWGGRGVCIRPTLVIISTDVGPMVDPLGQVSPMLMKINPSFSWEEGDPKFLLSPPKLFPHNR
jgi:hypothetical protein